MKHIIPCSAAEVMQWLRHLESGEKAGGISMAESAFVEITDETITDEQALRAALASRAEQYYHTSKAAPDGPPGHQPQGPGKETMNNDDD